MDHTYDSKFMSYTEDSSRYSARAIASLLCRTVKIESVLDIGCARGTWLHAWQDEGVTDVYGVDGDYVDISALVIAPEQFMAADLAQRLDLRRTFDLVQSLEVAEHIRAEAADQFVENLVHHSNGIILFSAAPPGQGGEFHVNEQPYDYWREKFRRHGFEAYDYIRAHIADDKSVSFWYRYNTLLYVHKNATDRLRQEVRASRLLDTQAIPDISPAWFRLRKRLVRTLPVAVREWLARAKAHLSQ